MTVEFKKPKRGFREGRGYTREDWDSVDSPELTDEEIASLRPAKDVLPAAFFEGIGEARRARGRPRKEAAKEAVTLRIDPDVLERYKATGEDWRALMSGVLRDAAPPAKKTG